MSLRIHRSGPDHWTPKGNSGLSWSAINGRVQPMHDERPWWRRVFSPKRPGGQPNKRAGEIR